MKSSFLFNVILFFSCHFSFLMNGGEYFWDFETDPFLEFVAIDTTQENYVWGGQGFDAWQAEGNPGGFLSLTEAAGNTHTIGVLPVLDDGALISAFQLSVDIRMGNGSIFRPADGMSINFARPSLDPLLADLNSGSVDLTHTAMPNAQETGTSTGISVSFDAWAGNALPDGPDIEGVIVRVDNKTIGRFAMPTRNGDVDDITSLQTGPRGGTDSAPDAERGDPNILSWAPLEIELLHGGNLNVSYKNHHIIENFSTEYFPSPGQIVLMGRTGRANQIHHLDNLRVITPLSSSPICSHEFTSDHEGFHWKICQTMDRWLLDSIQLQLDGQDISNDIQITNSDTHIEIGYAPDHRFESDSDHFLELTLESSSGIIQPNNVEFRVSKFTEVPSNLAIDNVDNLNRGFLMHLKQSNRTLVNSIQARLDHLMDQSNNVVDIIGSENYVWHLNHINLDESGNASGEFRLTGNNDAFDAVDDFIPGLPGTTGSNENVTGLIQTIVRIPEPGMYEFGFNSDDGFLSVIGENINNGIVLGEFDGIRNSSTTSYKVFFESAGDYPFHTLWYNGKGWANLEWFTIAPNKALLNDTSNGGLTTFAPWAFKRPRQPRFRNLYPAIGSVEVSPKSNVMIVLEDNDGFVDLDSIHLTLEGSEIEADIKKNNGVTTIFVDRSSMLWDSGQFVSALLQYRSNGNLRELGWSWLVADYVTLSQGRTDLGTGSEPGFEMRVFQSQISRENSTDAAELQLTGNYPGGEENIADVLGGTISLDSNRPGVVFLIDNVINMDQAGGPQGVFRASGDGFSTDRRDDFIPGIPGMTGSNDNVAAEILCYIEFPKSDYYEMIFNSDDGFLVSETHGAANQRGATLGEFNGGKNASDYLFGFFVAEPGVYPIRALWYEGSGRASLEWSSVIGNGRVLINDVESGGLAAFRTRISEPPPTDPLSRGVQSIRLIDDAIVLEFNGVLKYSSEVQGPYIPVEGATSPYTLTPHHKAGFFFSE